MKKFIFLFVCIGILAFTVLYREEIQVILLQKIIFPSSYTEITYNNYSLQYETHYKNIEPYKASNKEELLNILFTILNSGNQEREFLCDYENCSDDLTNYINASTSYNLNNYVHPYNSYQEIQVTLDNLNKVKIKVIKNYDDRLIEELEKKMDSIILEIITPDMSDVDKIKAFHDYVINNTKYDEEYLNSGITDITNPSNKASGPLFYGKSLCGGYSDTMSIFLNRLKFENYKLSTYDHVWNYVYLDNTWYHLDLTWNDPLNNLNQDILLHDFFLITDQELMEKETGSHGYIIPNL